MNNEDHQPIVIQFRDIWGRPDRDVYLHDIEDARRYLGSDDAAMAGTVLYPKVDPGETQTGRRPRQRLLNVADVGRPDSGAEEPVSPPYVRGGNGLPRSYPQVLERGCAVELWRSRSGNTGVIIIDADEFKEIVTLPGFLDDSQAAAVIDHGRAQHTKGRQDGADHLTAQLRHLIGAAPAPAPTRREVEELSRRLDRLEEAQPRRGRPL